MPTQTQVLLPFDLAPDTSEFLSQVSKVVKADNLVKERYGFRSVNAPTVVNNTAFGEYPMDSAYLEDDNGRYNFIATDTCVYRVDASANLLSNIHAWGNTPTSVSMAVFDNHVYIATENNPMLKITIAGVVSTIAAAPRAYCLASVGRFLITGNDKYEDETTFSQNRISWCAVNDPETWTRSSTENNLSGNNYFNIDSKVVNIVGIEQDMVVFLDDYIATGELQPQDIDYVFYFKPSFNMGLAGKNGLAQHQRNIFFLSKDGFYSYNNSQFQSIGSSTVDRSVLDNIDWGKHDRIQAYVEEETTSIYFSLPLSSSNTHTDTVMAFNYVSGGWSSIKLNVAVPIEIKSGEILFNGPGPSTVENLYPDFETIPYPLDSPFWDGSAKTHKAYIDSEDLKIKSLDSTTRLPAELHYPVMELVPGQMVNMYRVYPVVEGMDDNTVLRCRILSGDTNDVPVDSGWKVVNRTLGHVSFSTNHRYHQLQMQIDGQFSKYKQVAITYLTV